MIYKQLTAEYDAAMADLVRRNLKAHQLDIPGTAYFDKGLDYLSAIYDHPGRSYFVLIEEPDDRIGDNQSVDDQRTDDRSADGQKADDHREDQRIAFDQSTDDQGQVERLVGGIGLAEIDLFPDCCELQKLYLDDSVKGRGLGYQLIDLVEQEARRLGYKRIYLETHTNLKVAIHTYERAGYQEIERPDGVVHSTMNKFYLKEL